MEPVAFHLLVDGVYEPELAKFIQDRLKSGGIFVDVGANIGCFTIPAARKVGPSGHVIAIEASPKVFPYLEQNVKTNGLENVRLRHCAASNCDGTSIDFFDAPTDHFGMGALAPQFNADPVCVEARSLDRILADEGISHVDVLKVDVEGFEAEVFKGARRLLTSTAPPVIAFEFCDWAEKRASGMLGEAQRMLLEWDYELKVLTKSGALQGTSVLTTGFVTIVAIRHSLSVDHSVVHHTQQVPR
jgi:FkbM family methyltransferase